MQQYKTPDYPTNLLFFDTETRNKPREDNPKSEFHYFWFGWTIAYRREGRNRTRLIDRAIMTVDEFWQFIISRLDAKRPLWCFAHNIMFDLTVLDCWTQADKYGISVDLPVLEDPPVILCCSHPNGKVNFIDTFNYWKCSVSDIGESVGMKKMAMPKTKTVDRAWQMYCRRDVEILSDAVDKLIQWLGDNDLGPLSYTIASIALNTYKHRFMPVDIIHIHDNEDTLQLEREAYHGGLTHTYFIGKAKGPIHKLDVNSLYPAMMLNRFPVQPIASGHIKTPPDLLYALKSYGAVCECEITSPVVPYPVYDGERLLEAVGHFRTVLCGQELRQALIKQHVKSIDKLQLYKMADIFSRYVNYFWAKRADYKKKGDDIGSMFCKYLMNSLYGKFGQRSMIWVDLTYDRLAAMYDEQGLVIPEIYQTDTALPHFAFGVQHWIPLNYPEPLTVRYVGTCLQVRQIQGEHHESSPIIAAYVTSYARARMRYLRGVAGEKEVYYCDTDSLFTTSLGRKRLERNGEVDPTKLGLLKVESVVKRLVIYGPKDYLTDSQRVIKGIRKNAIPVCPKCRVALNMGNTCPKCRVHCENLNTFEQVQFEKVKSVMRREPDPYIEIKSVVKVLSRQYSKGGTTKSGWTTYPVLALEQSP